MDMNEIIYRKLTEVQWLMQKRHFKNHHAAGPMADPERGQGRLLSLLKLKDGISTKDMSHILGIRVSSLNELLAKLERNGYIKREPSEQDKRIVLNWLTDKGREENEAPADTYKIFDCLSEEEREKLAEYLERVAAALENELGENSEDFEEMRRQREEAFERFFEGKEEFRGPAGKGPDFRGLGRFEGFRGPGHHPHPHPHHFKEKEEE